MRSSSRKRARSIALAALLLRACASGAAPDVPDGVVLQGVYDGDIWRNAHGGRARGTVYTAHLDTSLALDAEKLWGWEGTRFYLRSFADNGASIARRAGSAMGPDNWEAGDAGARLLEAWGERSLLDHHLSIRAGLYDTTTEFDKNKSQVLFMNSAQGMNAPLALSGDNGPSTYPATALALRLRWQFDAFWTAKLAVMDGVAGDPSDPIASSIRLDSHDGALIMSELRYHTPDGHRFDVGYWRYTKDSTRLDAPAGGDAPASDNQGFYAAADTMLTSAPDDPLRGISVGARIAYAEAAYNTFTWFASASLTDIGFWSARPQDKVGIGFVYGASGAPFRRAQVAQDLPARPNEWVVEATWRAPLTAWLALQPDLQWIHNPLYAPQHRSALVWGLRFELTAGLGG